MNSLYFSFSYLRPSLISERNITATVFAVLYILMCILSSTHWKTFLECQQAFRKKRVGPVNQFFTKFPQLFCHFLVGTSNTCETLSQQHCSEDDTPKSIITSKGTAVNQEPGIRDNLGISETKCGYCGVQRLSPSLHFCEKNLKPVGGESDI